jgi:SET domain
VQLKLKFQIVMSDVVLFAQKSRSSPMDPKCRILEAESSGRSPDNRKSRMSHDNTPDPIVPAAAQQRCCDGCGLPPFCSAAAPTTKHVPLRRCSKCQNAWYHNAECQTQHYRIHKEFCCSQQQQQQQQQKQNQQQQPQQQNRQLEQEGATGDKKSASAKERAGTITTTTHIKEKANHHDPAETKEPRRQESLKFSIQERPYRGKCMLASQDISSGCPISHPPSTVSIADDDDDDNDGGGDLWLDDFFPAMVPPVLAEIERAHRCVVCFARCRRRRDSEFSSSTIVLCKDTRFPVIACTAECYQAHGQSWIDAEVATVKSCLSSNNSNSRCSSGLGCVVPPAMCLPKILPTALLVYRICWALIHESITWKEVECMACHHSTSMSESAFSNNDDAAACHQQAVFVTVATLLTNSINTTWRHDAHKQQAAQRVATLYVAEILARVKVNAFSITCTSGIGEVDNDNKNANDDDDAIGVGIFHTSHYMNHSCDPNARQSFRLGNNNAGQLPQLCIHARRDISAGEEITISYINHDHQEPSSRTRRRQELLRSYHFHCTCPICGND